MIINKPEKFKPKQFMLLTNKIVRNTDISDAAFRVLVYMLSFADYYTYSKESIAKGSGISVYKVIRALTELKKIGYIKAKKIEKSIYWDYIVDYSKFHYEDSEEPDTEDTEPLQ